MAKKIGSVPNPGIRHATRKKGKNEDRQKEIQAGAPEEITS